MRHLKFYLLLLFILPQALHAELRNYSVAIGKVKEYYLEGEKNEGRWPHYVIEVQANKTTYHCVLNLYSRANVPMKHKIIDLSSNSFPHLGALQDGIYPLPYHHDERAMNEGGLDYFRHPEINRTSSLPWKNNQLVSEKTTVPLFNNLLKDATRVMVFGERFFPKNGRGNGGIHDVHQNQGNKKGAAFSVINGIWQDGGVIIDYADGSRKLIMTQFEVQQNQSDEDGNGI